MYICTRQDDTAQGMLILYVYVVEKPNILTNAQSIRRTIRTNEYAAVHQKYGGASAILNSHCYLLLCSLCAQRSAFAV